MVWQQSEPNPTRFFSGILAAGKDFVILVCGLSAEALPVSILEPISRKG